MVNNNENESYFNENEASQEDEEESKSDEHLPHQQKSAYKPISFYHSGGERGLTLLMNKNQNKEEVKIFIFNKTINFIIQTLHALEKIRVEPMHGYDLNNANDAFEHFNRTGRFEVIDEMKCNKVQEGKDAGWYVKLLF